MAKLQTLGILADFQSTQEAIWNPDNRQETFKESSVVSCMEKLIVL
jgi:hypothetical protein